MLDYKKMVKDIDELVNNDTFSDLEMRSLGKLTRDDALVAIDILGRVYLISHCISCKACQVKYKLKKV